MVSSVETRRLTLQMESSNGLRVFLGRLIHPGKLMIQEDMVTVVMNIQAILVR